MKVSRLEIDFDKRFSKYPITALIRKELIEWVYEIMDKQNEIPGWVKQVIKEQDGIPT